MEVQSGETVSLWPVGGPTLGTSVPLSTHGIDASGEGAEVQHLTALSMWVQTTLCVKDCGHNLLLWDEADH